MGKVFTSYPVGFFSRIPCIIGTCMSKYSIILITLSLEFNKYVY